MRPLLPLGKRSALCFMILGAAAGATAAAQHDSSQHRHPAAEKLTNPVAATAQSVEAGKKTYEKFCRRCHGDGAQGDGMDGEGMDPLPANLTDADWEHGSSDGEIFVVIRDGTGDGMKPFKKKLTPREIWNVVNYVRRLAPAAAKSH